MASNNVVLTFMRPNDVISTPCAARVRYLPWSFLSIRKHNSRDTDIQCVFEPV